MFALPSRWVIQIKSISANHPYSGKDPYFRFFCVGKGGAKVFPGPTGSPLPSVQNNLLDKEAHRGWQSGCPVPFLFPCLKLLWEFPWEFHWFKVELIACFISSILSLRGQLVRLILGAVMWVHSQSETYGSSHQVLKKKHFYGNTRKTMLNN